MGSDRFKTNTIAMGIALCFIVIWEMGVKLMDVPVFILPPPSDIALTALVKAPVIWPHALTTFAEIVMGICLALATAVPLAIFMFANPGLERGVTPFLVASQAVPVFALAPLLVVWFGYGMASKVFIAWIIIFFPIAVTLLSGLKSCDREFRVLFSLMGASFFQKLRLLYWPWALPEFFSGLRVGVTVATIGAIIGEWVGSQKGLGYLMIQSNARLQTELVFAAILWLTAMGLGLWILVGYIEKKIIRWK